ncbi:glycosyltransferase [Qipengyuania qiaonensis]|uniref:Glycosyltransferase family 2 protein n=1 Tax=Qipengyuania qiaonensis TaxID=2867240 RepID=A0ABS7JES2_9SPHN|nr:glycosyltransferase family A protein [Qipengyuania qiaonensis]MBX7483507.1 glycosyltransferase family 2 protein [Qipengyuania qiaonensis]
MNGKSNRVLVTVLAHNEEARIAACLESLPLDEPGVQVTVVVNGSADRTAQIVRGFAARGVRLVEYAEGGKARSWNRFVLDEAPQADTYVFVDGDAELTPGAIAALESCLTRRSHINAASAIPMNGRNAEHYRRLMVEEGGLFGDCYALAGDFIRRFRASGVRLPNDLVGDDGLICALAHTDLGPESEWRHDLVEVCLDAGFYCEPNSITVTGLRNQSQRMTNYAVRRFQNRIITGIMRSRGPQGLPEHLAEAYAAAVPGFRPRLNPRWYWFDRKALARMRAASDLQAGV